MRTHRWLKALTFGLCLGAGADAAFAQAPWSGAAQGNWVTADGSPAPAPGTYAPPMPGTFQAPYATNDPNVLFPQGVPPQFSAWPQVSPYQPGNVSRDTTYYERGNWFQEMLTRKRDYYFGVNALNVITRPPGHAWIGAVPIKLNQDTRGPAGSPLPTYGEAAEPGVATTGGTTGTTTATQPAGYIYVDDGVVPYVYMAPSATGTPTYTVNNTLFPVRTTRIFNDFRSPGIQLDWGFDDEDGSGFHSDVWWGFQNSQTYQRGRETINGIPITQEIIIASDLQLLFARNGAVTFNTGIEDTIPNLTASSTNILGATIGAQKYDVMYRAQVQTQAGGGDLQLYLPDLTSSSSPIRLRPVYGAKYTYIGETFEFTGIDSGLSYTVAGAATGGGTGAGGAVSNTFRPTAGAPENIDSALFETQVNSSVRTHLAGPTAGLRYDFGRSRSFRLYGVSNFGLMANYETVRVNGFNAGENVATRFLTGSTMLDGDSHFSDEQNHSHVSPLFEQTFMSESRILAALPYTRSVPFLAAANFKIGYTTTFIGNVARPANSIQWNGFPKAPKVDIDYQTWSNGRINFGLEWNY